MSTSRIRLGIFSRYRDILFGLSTLLIIVFHAAEDIVVNQLAPNFAINMLAKLYMTAVGSIGVEIFLFLSGMGIYYSLSKNSDRTSFYARRMLRIIFPYVGIGFLYWFIRDVLILKLSFLRTLYDFSFLSFWIEGVDNLWYIGFIIPLYLLSPFLHRFTENAHRNMRLASILLIHFAVCLLLAFAAPNYALKIEIAFSRISIFLIGYALGPAIKENKPVSLSFILGNVTFLAVCMILWRTSSYDPTAQFFSRWTKCFYGILFMLICCVFFHLINIERIQLLLRPLRWMGKYSLELYLLHVSIRSIVALLNLSTPYLLNYLLVVILSFVLAPFCARLNTSINRKITK